MGQVFANSQHSVGLCSVRDVSKSLGGTGRCFGHSGLGFWTSSRHSVGFCFFVTWLNGSELRGSYGGHRVEVLVRDGRKEGRGRGATPGWAGVAV